MRNSSLLLLAACSLGVGLAQAQSITFDGEVSDQTCTVSVNGQSVSTVILAVAKTSDLSDVGNVAGLTPFTIEIKNCAPLKDGTDVKFHFVGHNVTNGHLGNTASTNAATGVAIQITRQTDGTDPIDFSGGVKVEPAFTAKGNATGDSRDFAARYISIDPNVHQGRVTAIVDYTLSYL